MPLRKAQPLEAAVSRICRQLQLRPYWSQKGLQASQGSHCRHCLTRQHQHSAAFGHQQLRVAIQAQNRAR